MKARGVVRITPADAGARVSIRSRLNQPGAGPSMTDTVGTLLEWTDGVLRIHSNRGAVVTLNESDLVAARIIPERIPQTEQERG